MEAILIQKTQPFFIISSVITDGSKNKRLGL